MYGGKVESGTVADVVAGAVVAGATEAVDATVDPLMALAEFESVSELHEPIEMATATIPATAMARFDRGIATSTGETYNNVVKMTVAKGTALNDPLGFFYSSPEGNTRRAIDFHEREKIDEVALKTLVRATATLNEFTARR